jgi:hypothetical protein
MKIKLFQPVVFDGKTYEDELDTAGTPISAESIIQRGWGEEIKELKRSKKSDQNPALSESPATPIESDPVPAVEQPQSSNDIREPNAVEPPKPPKPSRKRS